MIRQNGKSENALNDLFANKVYECIGVNVVLFSCLIITWGQGGKYSP